MYSQDNNNYKIIKNNKIIKTVGKKLIDCKIFE